MRRPRQQYVIKKAGVIGHGPRECPPPTTHLQRAQQLAVVDAVRHKAGVAQQLHHRRGAALGEGERRVAGVGLPHGRHEPRGSAGCGREEERGGGGQAGKGPACFSPTRTPCRLTLDGGAPLPPARPQDELSGADIKAMCTEAGLLALRERRMKVTQVDFRKAKEKVMYKKKEGVPEGLYM